MEEVKTTEELLEKAEKALDQENFSTAKLHARKVTDQDPANARGYYIQLLAEHQVKEPSKLPLSVWIEAQHPLYEKILSCGDEELICILEDAKLRSARDTLRKGAEEALRKKDYDTAFECYVAIGKEHGGHEKALQVRYIQAEEAMRDENFEAAARYFSQADGYQDALKRSIFAQQAADIHKEFKEEIGNTHVYMDKQLKQLCPAELAAYRRLERKVNLGTYSHGIGYLIAACLMVAASAAMCANAQHNDFIYLLFGICTAFVVHKVFDWDFGLFKSSLTALALAAAPLALQAVFDWLFDTGEPGCYITLIYSAIVLIRSILQEINRITAKKAQYQKTQMKINVIEPKIRQIRKQLVDKYGPRLDRNLVARWANLLNLN